MVTLHRPGEVGWGVAEGWELGEGPAEGWGVGEGLAVGRGGGVDTSCVMFTGTVRGVAPNTQPNL